MTEQTRDVPKKPESMDEFWTADGKKEYKNKDGVWLKYRNVTIGPFPNRSEASWYDGQVQDVIQGWNEKEFFAGRIFPFGDAWYVERWETNDGPFLSLASSVEHRQTLFNLYIQNGEAMREERGDIASTAGKVFGRSLAEFGKKPSDDMDLMQKAGHAVRGGMKWGPISESGRVQVTPEGKVKVNPKISAKVTSEDPVTSLEKPHKDSSFWQNAKKDSDDIVDVTFKMDRFLDDVAESLKEETQSEEPQRQVLYQEDVPVLIGLLMDQMGITSFQFTTQDLMTFKGHVSIDSDYSSNSSYTVRMSE